MKRRLTVDLAPSVHEAVAEIQRLIDADTRVEVIRRSVFTYLELVRAKESGNKVLLIDRNGQKTRLIV